MPDQQPPTTNRVNAELIPDAAQALTRLIERTGLKKVDVLNRALQIYDFLEAETRLGTAIVLRSQDGSEQTVRFL